MAILSIFLFAAMLSVSACSTAPQVTHDKLLRSFEIKNSPLLGKSSGREIRLGGFSGLIFEGKELTSGKLRFLTHTDRGPNAPSFEKLPGAGPLVPFLFPVFQPEWTRLVLDPVKGDVEITERIPLRKTDHSPLTGLPNVLGMPGMAVSDEAPIDPQGKRISNDPFGLDLEAIARDPDGSYWMGEEYRPSICHFDSSGKLLERFIPKGSNRGGAHLGTEVLPSVYSQRRTNRGFEGIALKDGKIYAFLQSPLDHPDGSNDKSSRFSQITRIVEFDPSARTTTGQYLYLLEDRFNDRKIGDAIALPNGDFLVLEQTSEKGIGVDKKLFRISLKEATNLEKSSYGSSSAAEIETLLSNQLSEKSLMPVRKKLVVDLGAFGYNYVEKAEGLALVDRNTVVIISDNDFGLVGEPTSNLTVIRLPEALW